MWSITHLLPHLPHLSCSVFDSLYIYISFFNFISLLFLFASPKLSNISGTLFLSLSRFCSFCFVVYFSCHLRSKQSMITVETYEISSRSSSFSVSDLIFSWDFVDLSDSILYAFQSRVFPLDSSFTTIWFHRSTSLIRKLLRCYLFRWIDFGNFCIIFFRKLDFDIRKWRKLPLL